MLQHTTTCCNTLQHTATHCNTLQYTATPCNTLMYNTGNNTCIRHIYLMSITCIYTATHCNTLQHTATHLYITHLIIRRILLIYMTQKKSILHDVDTYLRYDSHTHINIHAHICVYTGRRCAVSQYLGVDRHEHR